MAKGTEELQEFANAISTYMNTRKVSVEKALKMQGRLLTKQIIDFTPPNTLAQGRKAIASDVRKTTKLLTPKEFISEKIKKLVSKKKRETLTKVFSRFRKGKLKGSKVEPFGKQHEAQHQRSRDRRGRAKSPDKFQVSTLTAAPVNAYTKRIQEKVGMAKGGWARAYARLGGKPADWYARHSNQGFFVDQSGHRDRPYILLRNRSPWAGSGNAKSVVRNAMRSRAHKIKLAIANGHVTAIKSRLKKLKSFA
jgi:hypothetical protein